MKVEIDNLMAIKNYATMFDVTTSYIYKLVREAKMSAITIDGVLFIDKHKYPSIPMKRRK